MNAEAFMDLVKSQGGFEFVIGFPEDVDHYIGGHGNKYWYLINRGKKQEYYVGTYANDAWSDKFYTKKGDTLSEKSVPVAPLLLKSSSAPITAKKKRRIANQSKLRRTATTVIIIRSASASLPATFRKTMASPSVLMI